MKTDTSKIICILIVMLYLFLNTIEAGNNDPGSSFYKIPQFMPPSPQASLLGRYGEIPVSLTNGLVNISIPIYEIKLGKAVIPINISFHGGGVKVGDQASSVGLGWVLNAGGVVTRSVRGLPDEFDAGFFSEKIPAANDIDGQDVMGYNIIKNNYDGESDIYFYNFGDKAGKILFTARTDTSMCKPIIQPYSPIKVSYNGGDTGFDIIDNDGTYYSFQETETSWGASHDLYPSSWYISTIINQSGQVSFGYSTTSGAGVCAPSMVNYSQNYPSSCEGSLQSSYSDTGHHSMKELDGIDFPGGHINLIYGTYAQFSGDGIKPLLKIEIITNDGNKLIYNFKYSHFDGDVSRLRLDAMEKTDGTLTAGTYQFVYENIAMPTCNSSARDLWGFYNGMERPYISMWDMNSWSPVWSPSGCYPNAETMKMGMIKKIVYPTGGYTSFEFEPHQVNGQIVGGLRIKQQKDYDNNGKCTITKYNYPDAYYANAGFEGDYNVLQAYARHSITYVDYPCSITGAACIPTNFTKTYYNSFSLSSLGTSGSPVCYRQVEVIKYSGQDTLKTLYTFLRDPDQVEGLGWRNTIDNSWKRTLLSSRVDYKYSGGQYVPVLSVTNNYTPYTYNNLRNRGMMSELSAIQFHPFLGSQGGECNPSIVVYIDANGHLFNQSYTFNHFLYDHPVETLLLSQTTETSYTSWGNITKATTYAYDNKLHLQPTMITTISSEGDTLSTRKLYVGDMDNSTPVMVALKSQNRVTEPVQVQLMKNRDVYNTIDYTYGFFNQNAQVELAKISNHYPNRASEDRVFYNRYDSYSNPVDISVPGGNHTCYLWGYNFKYPIAKIDGITYGRVDTLCSSAYLMNLGSSYSPSSLLSTLRSNLSGENVTITTDTYQMLYGLSSTTDAKGILAKYQYDGFGRLITSFNHDNQIISQFAYNYHSPSLFYNSVVSGGFYKNDCGTGYNGSYVIYTVPAHKYSSPVSQSDANQLAQNEMYAQGQAYANAQGTCTAIVCSGEDRKMVNGVCEIGVKVYTKSIYLGGDPEAYQCYYHYEWSDGSWSNNYSEISYYGDCLGM
jgi:YD repeat-containing protein